MLSSATTTTMRDEEWCPIVGESGADPRLSGGRGLRDDAWRRPRRRSGAARWSWGGNRGGRETGGAPVSQ